MDINNSLKEIKGVGEKTAELFEKLDIRTINDLIHYYPRSYDCYEPVKLVKDASYRERNVFCLTVFKGPVMRVFGGRKLLIYYAKDETGPCEIKFYNSNFLSKVIKSGMTFVFRGYTKEFAQHAVMEQPSFYKPEEYDSLVGSIVPIYSLTKGLSNLKIQKTVTEVLKKMPPFGDFLNSDEIRNNNFTDTTSAFFSIHYPLNNEDLYRARRRLVFNEFIGFLHMVDLEREKNNLIPNKHPMIEVSECNRLLESLPYNLTNAQLRAIKAISDDMCSDNAMNRLLEGDVGSGKTIVAFCALLQCVKNNYQGALMAPTEVLAKQHFSNLVKLNNDYKLGLNPVLLTGKISASEKKRVYELIKTKQADIVIGTHAMFSENVEFKDLALVITDEQHRFGVRQREAFRDKGISPHILVMSATPIPRTLAMILYGDLDISILDEKPAKRMPISNCVVDSSFREKIYKKMLSEIQAGHQAYCICAQVDDNEEAMPDVKSVTEYTKELKEYFGESIRILSLHGKMKSADKERIMEEFKEHKADILVSTTVIEVGVDVPNATFMLVENAERFGLSQLHQIRGRIGRGDAPSFCVFLSDSNNEETVNRLKILNNTNDGFEIAKEDCRQRGPGELSGVRQSGELSFEIGDVFDDSDIMTLAASMYPQVKDRLLDEGNGLIDFRSI